jgi:hypothetical protein
MFATLAMIGRQVSTWRSGRIRAPGVVARSLDQSPSMALAVPIERHGYCTS